MIKGIKTVVSADIEKSLINVLLPKFKLLLETRGAGHCMKVSDLDTSLMYKLCEELAKSVDNSQVVVLANNADKNYSVTSTKLVELRNPDEQGNLRSPLLVFVPNELKTSSEDSFGEATFEHVDITEAYSLAFQSIKEQCPASLSQFVEEIVFILNEKASLKINPYQWLRYILTIQVNDFDPSVLGAALYELGLIPDLELHQDHSMLVRKLVKNHESI